MFSGVYNTWYRIYKTYVMNGSVHRLDAGDEKNSFVYLVYR